MAAAQDNTLPPDEPTDLPTDQPANQRGSQPTQPSTHLPTTHLADSHRRYAAWLRREGANLLEQAEWHTREAARLETAVPPRAPAARALPAGKDDGGSIWQPLLGAVVGGLGALWWHRRTLQERRAGEVRHRAEVGVAADDVRQLPLPSHLPECCIEILARPGWYDRNLLRSVKIKPASWFVRAISDPRVAGTEIAATTIGDTIYFRQPTRFDPHSPEGLALLAHEIRHVEQYRAFGGLAGFALEYLRDYLGGGYGTNIPFEKEAYAIQRTVAQHLEQEFAYNAGKPPCLMTPAGHERNPQYVSLQSYPELDRWLTAGQALV
jgi:hypothetical protein